MWLDHISHFTSDALVLPRTYIISSCIRCLLMWENCSEMKFSNLHIFTFTWNKRSFKFGGAPLCVGHLIVRKIFLSKGMEIRLYFKKHTVVLGNGISPGSVLTVWPQTSHYYWAALFYLKRNKWECMKTHLRRNPKTRIAPLAEVSSPTFHI